jgi:hypothetical protein
VKVRVRVGAGEGVIVSVTFWVSPAMTVSAADVLIVSGEEMPGMAHARADKTSQTNGSDRFKRGMDFSYSQL